MRHYEIVKVNFNGKHLGFAIRMDHPDDPVRKVFLDMKVDRIKVYEWHLAEHILEYCLHTSPTKMLDFLKRPEFTHYMNGNTVDVEVIGMPELLELAALENAFLFRVKKFLNNFKVFK